MPMAVPLVSHDEKSDVAPHFSYLNLRTGMVLLPMFSASFDTDISDDCITLHQCQWHHVVVMPVV